MQHFYPLKNAQILESKNINVCILHETLLKF
jgi:hypothetical protein